VQVGVTSWAPAAEEATVRALLVVGLSGGHKEPPLHQTPPPPPLRSGVLYL